ncbi:response regulator [Thalassotalea psychrophila]|uniref:Response regulator n=1 Tax=Thalassotalea psychrophila TaxID=3065647 RepID=A0ABY9TVJ8_9GAMM|nr:response regulator [Colwelliaceae bacterium SQ149]
MIKILVVEDESQIAKYIYKYLTLEGFEVTLLNSGEFFIQTVQQDPPSLVVLDLMLPVKDGVACCKELREFSDIPVIMLTAKSTEVDRIIGLEAGADDYVCKPFSAKELVLRVKAILRRFKIAETQSGLILNKGSLKLEYQDDSIKLTKLEFSLMELLYRKPSRIFSRQQIMSIAYMEEKDITDRAVDSHVKNLRKKIRSLNIESIVIDCVYGAGYQYLPLSD